MNRRQRRARHARRAAHGRGRDDDGVWLTEGQLLPLRWLPWYAGDLGRVDGMAWVWPLIQDACELPDPAAFPAFVVEWSPQERRMLARYVNIAERIVGTTVMSSTTKVTYELLSGRITKEFPADDASIGFMTLLRQVFKPSEEASFDMVRNLIADAAHRAGATEATAVLKTWRNAHRRLMRTHLRALMSEIVVAKGLGEPDASGGRRAHTKVNITPAALIDVYLNGDLMHWGDKAEVLAEWGASASDKATMEFEMRNDSYVLAHFYAGFAAIVRRIATSGRWQPAS